MAICEHNRWNVEKLMMGYSMITEKENKMLIEFVQMRKKYDPKNEVTKLKYDEYNAKHEKMKADLKTGYRKAHPNICDYLHLDKADPGAKNYDEILNAAIPYIWVKGEEDRNVKILSNLMVDLAAYLDVDPKELGVNELVYYPALEKILEENETLEVRAVRIG